MQNAVRGFSLIEGVTVVVILAVLAGSVLMNSNLKSQHNVTVQADEFRRALAHAQLIALSRGARVRVTATTSGYTAVSCDPSCSITPLTDPATGAPFSVNLSATEVTMTAGTIDFDSLGRPLSGGALIGPSPSSFTFTGGGNSVSVTVRPITGFAQTG